MAISAKFQADFSSFSDAVAKAQVELRSFETSAGKVEKSLQRMTDSFSGRKIIADATLMAKAVDSIGGPSKLTAAELQNVSARAQEAIAKMKAMGIEVPPQLQRVATETTKASGAAGVFTKSLGGLNQILGALGVSLTIGGLVSFGRSLLQTADQLVKVADRTGLTTTEVQRLQHIANQSGNTLDELTSAIGRLQNNLVSGDKGAVAAVKALGLNFQSLRNSTPFDQMEQIATAIGKVPDPAARAALAMELFGRQGAAILPTLIADFKRLGDEAPRMSDKTVRALEKAGDQLNLFAQTLKVVAAEGYNLAGRVFDQLSEGAFQVASHYTKVIIAFVELGKHIPGVAKALDLVGVSTEELRKQAQFFDDAAGSMRAQLNRVDGEVRKVVPGLTDYDEILQKASKSQRGMATETEKAARAFSEFRNFVGLRQMEDAAAAMNRQAEEMAETTRLGWAMEKMYRANAAALGLFSTQLSGIGVLMPALNKTLGDQRGLFGKLGDFFKGGVSSLFGGASSIGGALKNVVGNIGTGLFEGIGNILSGGLTSLLSKGIGLIGKGIGKLFGIGPSEKKKVDEMRQAFIDQIGGWDDLNKAAQRTGLTLDRVLNARTVKDYEAAIKELSEAMAFQDAAMATLDETAKKYGFTLEELGPKFAAAELDKKAQELFKDFKVLTAAGIDVEMVIGKMGGAINDFVQQSIAMGVDVPNAMRPMIEKMIELGLLTDANGNIIASLEESGINFAMSMSEGFRSLIDEVRRLTEAIARGLGIALDSIADQISNMPDLNVGVNYNVPDIPQLPGAEFPGFASGTGGKYLDFGSGTLAMLHGKEKITPLGEDGGGGIVVNVYGSVTTERDLAQTIRQHLDDEYRLTNKVRAA